MYYGTWEAGRVQKGERLMAKVKNEGPRVNTIKFSYNVVDLIFLVGRVGTNSHNRWKIDGRLYISIIDHSSFTLLINATFKRFPVTGRSG